MKRYRPELCKIDELISAGKHADALTRCRSIATLSLDRTNQGYHCILTAHSGLLVGEYCADLVDQAVEIFRFDEDTGMFARAKYLKGWMLSALGKHLDAKEVLLESYTNYLRCNDLPGAATTLNQLSYVVFQTGDIQTAIKNLERCCEILKQLGNSSKVAIACMNLATLYFWAGRIRDSIDLYSKISDSLKDEDARHRLAYFSQSCLPHGLSGDIARARKIVGKCEPFLESYKRDRAIYYENLGWICILDKDYKAAEKAFEEGLKISLEIAPESTLVSQIKRLMGDLYVATGNMDGAERIAAEALEVAEKINERVEVAACYRIYARVAQSRGKHATARDWYKKAMDIFSLIGSRYELAVTRFLAASGCCYQSGERTAMLYLAREYFSSEQISHFVDSIDRELNCHEHSIPGRIVRSEIGQNERPVIVGSSPQMKKILSLVSAVAPSDMTVFLTGQTGTGKDLMAKYIHYHSGRAGQFVTVNAAALPASMIESELFGYARGAFTGADRDKPGLFEVADGGTFYLNEVADATAEFQAKLLEVLETKQVRRLGENSGREVNFRLIAATNHDLAERMKENLFRCDLYHRLNEVPVTLPPLRERREDIPDLVRYFLQEFGMNVDLSGSQEALNRLTAILGRQEWPGNIRELLAQIRYFYVTCGTDLSRMIDLALGNGTRSEKERLVEVLELTGWNRSKAASVLGVSEGTIRNRIKKYGLC